jgi:hypothetical protein
MADIQDIIVGAGATAGGTFVLGRVTYVAQVSPAVISTSTPAIVNDGAVLGILSIPNSAGVYNAIVGATEMLRVQGGAIISGTGLDSVQLGRGAVSTGPGSVAIGQGAAAGVNAANGVVIGLGAASAGQSVVIGYNAVSPAGGSGVVLGATAVLSFSGGGNTGVAIGGSASATCNTNGGGAGDSLAIGTSAVANDGDTVIGRSASSGVVHINNYNVVLGAFASVNVSQGQGVAIGQGATVGAQFGVAVGQGSAIGSGVNNVVIGQGSSVSGAFANCVVLGQGSTAGASQQIVIGAGGLSLGANVCQLGTPGTVITTFVLGQGNTVASPPVTTIRFTNSSGADSPAGALVFQAPLSTGNGSPGLLVFRVGHQIGAGSTLQIGTTVLTVGDGLVTVAAGAALQLGNAYVAGVVVPTGSIVLKDSTGQSYRVSAVV